MRDAGRRIGVVVPGRPGDRGWIDGAWETATRLEALGHEVEVVVGDAAPVEPDWDVAVLHGIQYLDDALRLSEHLPTVVSDVPAAYLADPGGFGAPRGLTMVDWCWWLGARQAGADAARDTSGPIGFVAGPPVWTQRRVAAGFVEGVASVDDGRAVTVVHLPGFLAMEEGRIAGRTLVESLGCSLVAHSADSAGSAATDEARALGAGTYGFLTPIGDDLASLRSAIPEVLVELVEGALAGRVLPTLRSCSLERGEVKVERRER